VRVMTVHKAKGLEFPVVVLADPTCNAEAEPDGYLDLWAREHYKSTIITWAGTIQDVVSDPEQTVAIFSCTQKAARKFLHQIKQEFETNALLRWAYADVIWAAPKIEAPRWGLDGLVLKRHRTCATEACQYALKSTLWNGLVRRLLPGACDWEAHGKQERRYIL
jgi:UvrD-like helicase C-terminal domain